MSDSKVRQNGNLTKIKTDLIAFNGTLDLGVPMEEVEWSHHPAKDGRPEMFRAKVSGVEIWLKGLTPTQVQDGIVGHIELKKNDVINRSHPKGPQASDYLYFNILPLPEGEEANEGTFYLFRPIKVGSGRKRRKLLPPQFHHETDYATYRQNQPWQVILVRH